MKTFKTIKYKDFKKEKNTPDLSKTINFLKNGDFKSSESKKLVGSAYFRAKIDYENRLIFTFLRDKDETYIALLEVILNHDYNKSQFLRDKKVELEDFIFEKEEIKEIVLNPRQELRYLDKIISFSDEQENILTLRPPLLIIGSAGSGKTSVAIEKLKELSGKVLYISLSKHLVENSKSICGEKSNIDFYSFDRFLNTIQKQDKKEIDFNTFKIWAFKNKIKESEKYFEEFKGVLTANYSSEYLLEDEYLSIGVKQSLFKKEDRSKVYKSFVNYLDYLDENNFYDANIVTFDLMDKIKKVYDFIIIDEVQDFTNKEIYFISQALKNKNNIIFSGDSNQIIYSNFFSWSNLKTMLFDEKKEIATKILTQNYRNSQEITNLSNKLLKIKQLRFGSIDKESNYLIDSSSTLEGNVHFYKVMPKNIQDIRKSKDFAIIVFDENAKIEAKKVFNTELTFTVREAKGLEYKNIILYNFITNDSKIFFDIVKGISKEDLENELKYNRQKDKENRDLETYKITINSLYVALTRAIESLYILESKNHRLLELLDIDVESKEEIEVQESTKEEWLEEAKRLKELGKVEQAKEIEENIDLKVVAQKNKIKDLAYYEMKLFGQINPSNSIKNKLFKLAKKENDTKTIEILAKEIKFSSAMKYLNFEIEKDIESLTKINSKTTINKITKKLSDKESRKIFDYIESDKISKIKILISNGANLNVIDSNGFTPIMSSIWENNIKILKILIEHEADLNISDIHGVTPLIRASCNGLVEIVTYLLSINIDVNGKDNKGTTALMDASQVGEKEIVKLLIKNGADVNIKNHDGFTALNIATQYGQQEIIELLVGNSSDNYLKINNNIINNFFLSVQENDIAKVKQYIKEGVDVNIQINEGITALMIVSYIGHRSMVSYLIQNGANLDLQDNDGNTALILATEEENIDIIKILIEYGSDTTLKKYDEYGIGDSALIIAIAKNDWETNNNIEIVKLILKTRKTIDSIEASCLDDLLYNQEIAQISSKILVNHEEYSETMLMHTLMINGISWQHEKYGLSSRDKTEEEREQSSNDYMRHNIIPKCKLLLEVGVDINYSGGGSTALESAKSSGMEEVVDLLIENGAK